MDMLLTGLPYNLELNSRSLHERVSLAGILLFSLYVLREIYLFFSISQLYCACWAHCVSRSIRTKIRRNHQNKDELKIPLLLETIPTPKEFKSAISSLSPEQQRFCKAFRSMQLGMFLKFFIYLCWLWGLLFVGLLYFYVF
jgi:hypothetical protein